jgi:hypothetical protein
MIKILDIWLKSQTFSAAILSRLQTVIDETNPNPNANPTPIPVVPQVQRSTTPTASPGKPQQEIKTEPSNVANETGTGECRLCFISDWSLFGMACDLCPSTGLFVSTGRRRPICYRKVYPDVEYYRTASGFLSSCLVCADEAQEMDRLYSTLVLGQRQIPGTTRVDATRQSSSKQGIVYSVATMLQIYIPKAIAMMPRSTLTVVGRGTLA